MRILLLWQTGIWAVAESFTFATAGTTAASIMVLFLAGYGLDRIDIKIKIRKRNKKPKSSSR
jgi:uncharacterized membrane protein